MELVERLGRLWIWHIVKLNRMKYNLKVLNAQKRNYPQIASGR